MSRAVGADQSSAVEGETDRQALDRHVMDHLVIGALKEGGIDGAEGLVALRRQAGGEGDRMLLGDSDIEAALRKLLGEEVETRARRHGGRYGDDLLVRL